MQTLAINHLRTGNAIFQVGQVNTMSADTLDLPTTPILTMLVWQARAFLQMEFTQMVISRNAQIIFSTNIFL